MTIGIRAGGPVVAPPTTQSPVQAPHQGPAPAPAPMPVPVPGPGVPPVDPRPPGMPGPIDPPPWTPFPPTDGPGTPPWTPFPPTDGPGTPPSGPGTPPSGPDGPGRPPQPPTLPPDGSHPPTGPGKPPAVPTPPGAPPSTPTPIPTPDPGPDPIDDGFDLAPWLIGAGVVGAGIAGVLAIRTGARNVQALQSLASSHNTGALNQGGLHAIRDAQLGARFAAGIGTSEYLMVALPGINRVGTGGRLTAVARGHLDHAELLASSAAMRRAPTGDGVLVHEPLRQTVLDGLTSGRSMRGVLDDLDRSAAKARPVFDNPQLVRYWDQASIVERGPRAGADHVTSAIRVTVPELRLDGGTIIETGRAAKVNQIIAGRGANLGERDLAGGIGAVQSANISTLPPALQRGAIEASGVSPARVEEIGLRGAFTERWRGRLG